MSGYKEKIVNLETGEETWRDLSEQESAEFLKGQQAAALLVEKENETEIKKSAAKAKLAALGLTADDLKALGL